MDRQKRKGSRSSGGPSSKKKPVRKSPKEPKTKKGKIEAEKDDGKAGEPEHIPSLVESVECPCCFCLMKDPVTLNCGHSFCLACLNELKGKKKSIVCPSCRKRMNFKGGESLKVCISLRTVAELFEELPDGSIVRKGTSKSASSNDLQGSGAIEMPVATAEKGKSANANTVSSIQPSVGYQKPNPYYPSMSTAQNETVGATVTTLMAAERADPMRFATNTVSQAPNSQNLASPQCRGLRAETKCDCCGLSLRLPCAVCAAVKFDEKMKMPADTLMWLKPDSDATFMTAIDFRAKRAKPWHGGDWQEAVKITVVNGEVFMKFPFNEALKDLIKTNISNRRWNQHSKSWSCPEENLWQVVGLMKKLSISVPRKIEDRVIDKVKVDYMLADIEHNEMFLCPLADKNSICIATGLDCFAGISYLAFRKVYILSIPYVQLPKFFYDLKRSVNQIVVPPCVDSLVDAVLSNTGGYIPAMAVHVFPDALFHTSQGNQSSIHAHIIEKNFACTCYEVGAVQPTTQTQTQSRDDLFQVAAVASQIPSQSESMVTFPSDSSPNRSQRSDDTPLTQREKQRIEEQRKKALLRQKMRRQLFPATPSMVLGTNNLASQSSSSQSDVDPGVVNLLNNPPHKGSLSLPTGSHNCLYGLKFFFIGVLDSTPAEEMIELVMKYGGSVQNDLSSSVDFVVVGVLDVDHGLVDVCKKRYVNASIISEAGLFDIIRHRPGRSDSVCSIASTISLKGDCGVDGRNGFFSEI